MLPWFLDAPRSPYTCFLTSWLTHVASRALASRGVADAFNDAANTVKQVALCAPKETNAVKNLKSKETRHAGVARAPRQLLRTRHQHLKVELRTVEKKLDWLSHVYEYPSKDRETSTIKFLKRNEHNQA